MTMVMAEVMYCQTERNHKHNRIAHIWSVVHPEYKTKPTKYEMK